MSKTVELYQQYVNYMQSVADIQYAAAVLQWDQETYMPAKSAPTRARQLATLSVLAHEKLSSNTLEKLLNELLDHPQLNEKQQKNVALSYKDYQKQKKYTPQFVEQLSNASSVAFNAWVKARKENNFSFFKEPLHNMVQLKQQEAAILGYQQHAYNALLNEYEPGCSVNFLDNLFSTLEKPLKALIDKANQLKPIDTSFLKQHFCKTKQWEWGMYLLKALHFDFEAGRQDISEHPFTTNFSSKDVRLTTRIDEHDFANITWSCIHELGHGLYEQGLPEEEYGLPLGTYASLAIHESQSRLWENNVGRSLAFWQYYYPKLQTYFPEQLQVVSVVDFFKAINKISPSLIRTEADELTYHAHIQIRYNIEKLLIEGTLAVNDLPYYWNEQYKQYLNVIVPDDLNGVLQDVHWSHGSFGYFPTYSLGSLYAAQFYAAFIKENSSFIQQLENGNTLSLLQWLRQKIHVQGRYYNSNELCSNITQQTLNVEYFINYMQQKIDTIKLYEK